VTFKYRIEIAFQKSETTLMVPSYLAIANVGDAHSEV
jgi:hypothetical protein